jgi:anti-sigma-K factor RskA
LKGTKDAPQANALVAIDGQTGRAVLMAKGLPTTPEGKAYQLWFISGSQAPVAGKLFKTDADGNGMLEDQMPSSANSSSVLAVTLEPQAGVQSPTGPMYLLSPSK